METETLLQLEVKKISRNQNRESRIAVLGATPQSGKTTTVFAIATGLVKLGHRVLVVDLDRSCSLTNWLIPRGESEVSIGSVLFGSLPVSEAVMHTRREKLSILAGSPIMGRAEEEWLGDAEVVPRFRRVLEEASQGHDYTIIDCPPGCNRVVSTAIASSDAFSVTFATHQLTSRSLTKAMVAISHMWSLTAPHGALLGLLENQMTSLNPDKDEMEIIRSRFGQKLFTSKLRRDTDLRKAMQHGETMYSCGTFERLAGEVIKRMGPGGGPRPRTKEEEKPFRVERSPKPPRKQKPPTIIPRPSEGPLPTRDVSADEEAREYTEKVEKKTEGVDMSLIEAREADPETWNPKIDRPLPETPPTGSAKAPKSLADDEEDMFKLAARNMGLDVVNFLTIDIDEDLLATIPAKLAKELKVFPVAQTGMGLRVVLANPFGSGVVERLKKELGLAIFPCVAPNDDVLGMIRKHYQ